MISVSQLLRECFLIRKSNKKIINATPTKVGQVEFKSKLEALIYKTLVDKGFTPEYEVDTFVLLEGFKSNKYFRDGEYLTRKFTNLTYTPDFKIKYKDFIIYIEVKGFDNDVYPYKKKLFLNHIRNSKNTLFFEVHNKKGLIACIDTLDKIYEQITS